MLYAYLNGEKIVATRKQRRASCGICEGEVIAKCGEHAAWHWAHKTKDCDPWSEPETAWHKKWKELFLPDWREVRIGSHRCDIRTPRYVIELQHSYLPSSEVSVREEYYGKMLWIFDMRKTAHRLDYPSETSGQLRWPRFSKIIQSCRKPVFVHLRKGELLHIYDYGFLPYRDCVSYRRFTKDEFLCSVGAPILNVATPVAIKDFESSATRKKDLHAARSIYVGRPASEVSLKSSTHVDTVQTHLDFRDYPIGRTKPK